MEQNSHVEIVYGGERPLPLDIAMTMERGQEQDSDLVDRRVELGARLGQWAQFVAREEAREWEQQRRVYLEEEATQDAMMDAAREAMEEEERELEQDAREMREAGAVGGRRCTR